MSKKVKYIIFFVGVVAFIGGMILISNFLNKVPGTVDSATSNSINDEENIGIIKVSENNFEEVLKSDKKVLVDFYADWCRPCQLMQPILEKIAEENTDIKVVQVNVDYNYDLSMEYGAMSIPLFVAFENGEEVDRIVGATGETNLLNMFK